MRIALVTGTNRGLGEATALALAGRGIAVVAATRDGSGGRVVEQITTSGGAALPWQLDVGDLQSIVATGEQLPAVLEQAWGVTTIDIVVNNAGVGLFAPVGAVTAAHFDATFAVNVRGPFFLVQTLLPHIADGGRVVNISSSLSRHVSPGTAIYAASKRALEALTRSLALELGPRGIRVNAIAPGPTATDFNGGAMRDDATLRDTLEKQTALGRVGEPEEIADAVAALVSDDLRWLTGERVEVSGGVLL